MEGHVDSLLVINNEKIREMYGDFKISEAFSKADDVLATAAKGIAEIITVHGYINVDFADVETVMRQSGVALMGSARATGENRAIKAVEEALNSPLLNNNNIKGARNILLNITSGGEEITMDEIGQITDYVQARAGYDADLIWGNGKDESMGEEICVTIIATGFSSSSIPEVLANKKVEKSYHTLVEAQAKATIVPPKVNKPMATPQPPTRQETFRFDADRPKSDIDSLYSNVKRNDSKTFPEQEDKIDFGADFFSADDDDIDRIENMPAYKRRKINMRPQAGEEKKVSRFSLSADENNEIFLSENNPYLHDKVD